jgi:hypothetical protein
MGNGASGKFPQASMGKQPTQHLKNSDSNRFTAVIWRKEINISKSHTIPQ